MANLCIAVVGCTPEVGGVRVPMVVADDQGHSFGMDTLVNFSGSVVQINGDVVDAAKAEMSRLFGVTVGPADKAVVFGGAVL